MQLTRPKSVYRTQSLAMRVDRAGENRFAVALIAILSLAILSVLATTSALSRQHADDLATIASPS